MIVPSMGEMLWDLRRWQLSWRRGTIVERLW